MSISTEAPGGTGAGKRLYIRIELFLPGRELANPAENRRKSRFSYYPWDSISHYPRENPMSVKAKLTADELAMYRRLAEKASPWETRWAITEGRKRRGMFVAIDLEHRKEVLDALSRLEDAKERGAPAIRKLLALIEVSLPVDSQRLPFNQATLGKKAGLTPAQTSTAVQFLAEQRVLCCREKTRGRAISPTWEVYAGYASRLPEPLVLAAMDRQNETDFPPTGERPEWAKKAEAAMIARLEAGTLNGDTFSETTDPRQRNFDA